MANYTPDWVSQAIPTCTDNFAEQVIQYGKSGIESEAAAAGQYNIGLLLQTYYNDAALQDPWDFANLNVPWWYVMAVMGKVNCEVKPTTPKAARQLPCSVGRRKEAGVHVHTEQQLDGLTPFDV